MKKVLRIMNKSGDAVLEFDTVDAEATAKAKAEFDDLMKRHATVVTFKEPGQPGEVVRKFEDLAEESVVVPAIVGG
jgi:hypothetical protein